MAYIDDRAATDYEARRTIQNGVNSFEYRTDGLYILCHDFVIVLFIYKQLLVYFGMILVGLKQYTNKGGGVRKHPWFCVRTPGPFKIKLFSYNGNQLTFGQLLHWSSQITFPNPRGSLALKATSSRTSIVS